MRHTPLPEACRVDAAILTMIFKKPVILSKPVKPEHRWGWPGLAQSRDREGYEAATKGNVFKKHGGAKHALL